MDQRKTIAKTISGVLIGGMLLSGGIVYAADNSGNNSPGKISASGQAVTQTDGWARAQKQQRIKAGLKALVDQGTINQPQSDKIKKQFEETQKERKALFGKMKGMTKEERRQYMKDNKAKIKKPLEQLVQDGVISQDQAKAIGQELFSHQDRKQGVK